jgi:predicted transcriptional regulator
VAGLMRRQYLVTEDQVAKLDSLSKREGVSATEIVRRAIESYHPDRDDAELERLIDIMTQSVREAVKEVRAARRLVHQANRDYSKRKAG